MLGSINIKLRPIKLGFLVNPNDKKSLMRAIEINSMLWGGSYNPIIPTFKKIPASGRKIMRGLAIMRRKYKWDMWMLLIPTFLFP